MFLRTSAVVLCYLIIRGPDNYIATILMFYTLINSCFILNYFLNINNFFDKKITKRLKNLLIAKITLFDIQFERNFVNIFFYYTVLFLKMMCQIFYLFWPITNII